MSVSMDRVDEVGEFIRAILNHHLEGRFQEHLDGMAWTVERGSCGAAVTIVPDEPEPVVRITAPVVIGVEPSEALYRRVATDPGDFYFGRLYVTEINYETGPVHVVVAQEIVPTSLIDPNFLPGLNYFLSVLNTMMGLGDKLDDEYIAAFGGRPFSHEDVWLLLEAG